MTSELLFFLVQAGFFKNNISLLFQFIIQLAESSKGSTPSNEVPVTKPTTDFNYIIGGLFPTLPNGNPNVILAEGLAYEAGSRKIISTTNSVRLHSWKKKIRIAKLKSPNKNSRKWNWPRPSSVKNRPWKS